LKSKERQKNESASEFSSRLLRNQPSDLQKVSGAPLKTIILHHANGGSLLQMDDPTRLRLEMLGVKALSILEDQDPFLWAHAADTGFLALIKRGARVLRDLGVYTMIELSNGCAHHAFITCSLLALRIEDLRLEEKRTLREALLILSECCTVHVNPVIVPPFEGAPKKVKSASRLTHAYRMMINKKPVSLADLLRMLQALEYGLSPAFVPLICDLRTTTEGLRKALEQTKKKRRRAR
jgi:hypothetical protein